MTPTSFAPQFVRPLRKLSGALLWSALFFSAASGEDSSVFEPDIAPASEEGRIALKRFRLADGLEVELFAAEPMLANPVALTVDHLGRVYVVETFRHGDAVTDTRAHMYWLDDDLACRTVEDRVAMYRKHHAERFDQYRSYDDRVRRLVDSDGDGQADRATVFAEGFTSAAAGIGAGVLTRGQDVWYTCIPNLWHLRDTDDDGVAETKQSLHHGFGVHVGYLGHDLHGLCFGPDGRLYFSIGDRGTNVPTDGGRIFLPDTGAVFRCEPDGSDLEVFASGLRNPQELAFDDHGNLFTVDNNSDSGDRARWVHLVEGGDSGWRMGYQYITAPVSRGPWNEEKLWHPHFEGQAAYIVPPVANYSDGPSGLAYYPGTGLGERFEGHFFLCDFRGDYAHSGVRLATVEPRGAGFAMQDRGWLIESILATDVDFGPEGAVYVSDWVQGWEKPRKGRIYRVFDPDASGSPAVDEVRQLLAGGFADREVEGLLALLKHADRRVRQEAQFELATRAPASVGELLKLARTGANRLARLHAVWALGQIGRRDPSVLTPAVPLLGDADPEVRAQLCRVLGDASLESAASHIVTLLKDANLRVRSFAALALHELGDTSHVEDIVAMLRENGDRDAVLRHCGVMALVGAGDVATLLAHADDPSVAVRTGILLALRRLGSGEVARFLDDDAPHLVLEAARAIYDVPIPGAYEQLAALLPRGAHERALQKRILNAQARLRRGENARAIAAAASRGDLDVASRVEALQILATWASARGRDRVTGEWRPLAAGSPEHASEAAESVLPRLVAADVPRAVRTTALEVAARLSLERAIPLAARLARDATAPTAVRIASLEALERLGASELLAVVRDIAKTADEALRIAAYDKLAVLSPAEALPILEEILQSGSRLERQGAFRALARMESPAADALISRWLDRLLAGEVAPDVQLDLIECAAARPGDPHSEKLERHRSTRDEEDPLAPFVETLEGGDAANGRELFFRNNEIYCIRCHVVSGEGGDVGPELTDIGSRKDRRYLLESIVAPDRQVAEGFDSVVLIVDTGDVYNGVLRDEDEETITLATSEGEIVVVRKENVLMRARGASAMPADLHERITRFELRDLIEYLAGLRTPS